MSSIKMKNAILEAWKELTNITSALEELSYEELKEREETLTQRLHNAQNILGEFVSDEDVMSYILIDKKD